MWLIFQASIIFAVVASNVRYHWTPNGYLAGMIGVVVAWGLAWLLSAPFWKTPWFRSPLSEIRRPEISHVSPTRLLSAPADSADIGEDDLKAFDPEEIVTLYRQGTMTLWTAVERVMTQRPQDPLDATIFREGESSILDLAQIEKIAAEWGMGG